MCTGKMLHVANHIGDGKGILVIGAAGKGMEDSKKPHPKGNPPMGKIAIECMKKAKVPVVLTKGAAAPPQDLSLIHI